MKLICDCQGCRLKDRALIAKLECIMESERCAAKESGNYESEETHLMKADTIRDAIKRIKGDYH